MRLQSQTKPSMHLDYDLKVSVLEKTFSTAYFLMKEYLPKRKFLPLINFMTNVMGVTEIKYFQHRSEGF